MFRNALKLVFALALFLCVQTSGVEAGSYIYDGPPTTAEAQQYMQQGSYEEAAIAWSEILAENPDNGTAWFNLGYSLHISGNLEEAIKAHKKAATFDQFKGIALYNLGCAYSLLGETDEAFEALTASRNAGFDLSNQADDDSDLDPIRNDPRYSLIVHGGESHSIQKKEHGNAKNAGNIEEMFQFVASRMQPIIQEIAPQIHERFARLAEQAKTHIHEIMGQVHQKISEDEELVEALEQIHQVLSENPKFQGIMQKLQGVMGGGNRGGSHQSTQPSAEAHETVESVPMTQIEEVKPVITVKVPSLSDAQRLQQSGQYKEAAKAFGAILSNQPDNSAVSFGYAYNLHMSGDYKAAIEAHKAAAEFDNLRGIAHYNLGCAYALTGQADKAIEALEASAEFGFDVLGSMKSDSDLKSLRKNERFIQLQKFLDGGKA